MDKNDLKNKIQECCNNKVVCWIALIVFAPIGFIITAKNKTFKPVFKGIILFIFAFVAIYEILFLGVPQLNKFIAFANGENKSKTEQVAVKTTPVKKVQPKKETVKSNDSKSDSVLEQIKNGTYKPNDSDNGKTAQRVAKGTAIDLGAGTFIGGKDIQVGLYDVTPVDGSGNFDIKSNTQDLNINEILGGDIGVGKVRTLISDGDQVQLQGINKTHFQPINTPFATSKQIATLYSGYWVVGQDIIAGKYTVGNNQSENGSNFAVYGSDGSLSTNEIIGGDQGVKNVTVDLKDGEIIEIGGSKGITLTPQ